MAKSGFSFSIPFLGSKTKVLVLEIGEEWLKMAGVHERGNKRKVVCLGAEEIKDLSEVEISQKILAFLKAKSYKPEKVIISHPAHNLTTRILSLPSTDPSEIEDILELQAVKQTPFTREEITIGFSILEKEDSGYSRVLLAISQVDIASRYYRIAEMAGCPADQITLSFEGVKQWFGAAFDANSLAADKVTTLVNVDWWTTDFLIMKGKQLLFARSLGVGASHLTTPEAISNELIGEIHRSIELGLADIKEDHIDQILVAGTESLLDDLKAACMREFNFECEKILTSSGVGKNITKAAKKSLESITNVSLVATLGHALDVDPVPINLIPPEVHIRKGFEARAKDLAVLGTLLLAFVTLLSAIGFEKIHKQSQYLESLQKQYKEIRQDASDIERLVAKMKVAKEQMNIGQNFLDVMYDVSEVLPNNIYLTSLQYSSAEKNATIRGISEDMSSVFQFLSTLEAAPRLEMVKTRNVTKRKVENRDVSEFEIVATLTGGESEES